MHKAFRLLLCAELLVAAAAFEPQAHPDACTPSSSQQQVAASRPPPVDEADFLDSSQAATRAPPPVALSPECTLSPPELRTLSGSLPKLVSPPPSPEPSLSRRTRRSDGRRYRSRITSR